MNTIIVCTTKELYIISSQHVLINVIFLKQPTNQRVALQWHKNLMDFFPHKSTNITIDDKMYFLFILLLVPHDWTIYY